MAPTVAEVELRKALAVERRWCEEKDKLLAALLEQLGRLEESIQRQAGDALHEQERIAKLEQKLTHQRKDSSEEDAARLEEATRALVQESQERLEVELRVLGLQEQLRAKDAEIKALKKRLAERDEIEDLAKRMADHEKSLLSSLVKCQAKAEGKPESKPDSPGSLSSKESEGESCSLERLRQMEKDFDSLQKQLAEELAARKKVQYENLEREKLVHEKDRQVLELQAELASVHESLAKSASASAATVLARAAATATATRCQVAPTSLVPPQIPMTLRMSEAPNVQASKPLVGVPLDKIVGPQLSAVPGGPGSMKLTFRKILDGVPTVSPRMSPRTSPPMSPQIAGVGRPVRGPSLRLRGLPVAPICTVSHGGTATAWSPRCPSMEPVDQMVEAQSAALGLGRPVGPTALASSPASPVDAQSATSMGLGRPVGPTALASWSAGVAETPRVQRLSKPLVLPGPAPSKGGCPNFSPRDAATRSTNSNVNALPQKPAARAGSVVVRVTCQSARAT